MALNKQAKVLTDRQVKTAFNHLTTTRNPERDRVMFALSVRAGLRSKEIASITWQMVSTATGEIDEVINLENKAAKGVAGGRVIPISKDLKSVLQALKDVQAARFGGYIVQSERGPKMSADTVQQWFDRLYKTLEFQGCSSHSGRRTFITNCAKKITQVGGSLRDVQQLAGHSSLATTQRYIEGDSDAKRKIVDII